MNNNPTYEEAADGSDLMPMIAALEAGAKKRPSKNRPMKVVAAVPTGSPAGSGRPQPKPLICRLADLMKEWRQTRDNMKARGEDDAAIAVECCMETLHEDVTNFIKEMKEYREHCAKQGNTEISHDQNGEPK